MHRKLCIMHNFLCILDKESCPYLAQGQRESPIYRVVIMARVTIKNPIEKAKRLVASLYIMLSSCSV